MTVSEENRQIAEQILAAMGAHDAAEFERLLAPDVRHWLPDSAVSKLGVAHPVAGIDSVVQLCGRGPKRYERIRFDALFIVSDEGGAAAFTRTVSRLRDGRDFSNTYAFFFRIEDGQIVEIWETPDTALMFEFFGM